MGSNVNLPAHTRAELVAAARAGVKREDLTDFLVNLDRRAKGNAPDLRAPTERAVGRGGGARRVELDRSHFDTLQTIAVLAAGWKDKLEATGIPAMEPTMWEHFVRAVEDFAYIEDTLGHLRTSAAATIDLIRLRDDLS